MRISHRPLLPGEVDFERWLLALIPAAWVTAALVLFFLPLQIPPCLLHHLTGIPCPGCGSTRATVALAHGEIFTAVTFNPAWTLACVGSAVTWFYCAVMVMRGKLRHRIDAVTSVESWILRIGFLLLILLNWAWVIWRECAGR